MFAQALLERSDSAYGAVKVNGRQADFDRHFPIILKKGGFCAMKFEKRKKPKVLMAFLTLVLVLALSACSGNSAHPSAGTAGSTSASSPSAASSDSASAGSDAAGDGQSDIEPGAHLLVWDNGDAEGKWVQYVAQEFTKKYGVPVKYETVKHTDAPGKIQKDGPAGLAADVFDAPHDHVGELASAGLILENFNPDQYQSDFMPAAVSGTSYQGKLYGYPLAIETYALFYNKDLVKQIPQTWDELIEQAKQFNDPKNKKYGFMMEAANFYYDYAFVGGYGGYIFDKDNTDPSKLGLNTPGAVQAGQFLERIHNEILPLKNEDMTYDVKTSLFKEGKLMYNMDGPWAVQGFKDAKVNFGVAPLPKLDNGKDPTSFSGIKGYYVNAYSQYPNAASLFAQFATSKEMLLKRYEMTGQISPRNDMLSDPQIQQDPIASAFLNQASHAVPMPNIPEMQQVWTPAGAAFAAMWNKNEDPQKALDNAVQQIQNAISMQKK